MATSAKMSFNYYQNGKYGTLPQNPQKDMEVTQDMHLKMSKKIAQLTKVIYALNTKNDEHDAVLQSIKEQHESELQQLLSETKEKVELYKNKINADSDHRKKIQTLEASLAEQEKYKSSALDEFERFKKRAEERECELKTEHSKRILDLSQEVLKAKHEFEEKIVKFEEWMQQLDIDKARALDEVKQKHELELDELRTFQRSQNSDWLNECAKVEDKFKTEIQELKDRVDALQDEKVKLEEDHELKMSKAQAFFEKELEALKTSQNSTLEGDMVKLRQEQEKMVKDFAALEKELKTQIDQLINQLSESEESVEKHKHELLQLQNSLRDKDSTSHEVNKQLSDQQAEVERLSTRLHAVETDLSAVTERCTQQAAEMLRKSTLIGELEATVIQKSSTIDELKAQVSKLKDKLAWLESERKNLESQKQNLSEEQQSQLKSLEQSLEDLSVEKQTLQQRLEREIQSLQDKYKHKEQQLTAAHDAAINTLNREHREQMDQQKTAAAEVLEHTKQEYQGKYDEDVQQLTAGKTAVMVEFERVKAELYSKLQITENEVKRLEGLVHESENGLGSATSHITNLKEAATKLKYELDTTRAELKATKISEANFKAELDKLKLLHASKLAEHQLEMKTRLEELATELDNKWTGTLRMECKNLREELVEQKEDEKKSALAQLTRLKDQELVTMRSALDTKISDLQKQIALLVQSVQQSESKSSSALDAIKSESEAEKKRLMQEMLDAAQDYANKIAAMETAHQDQIQKLSSTKNSETMQETGGATSGDSLPKEMEKKMRTQHIEDMKAQTTAHRATVESIKEQADRARLTEVSDMADKHKTALAELRDELTSSHLQELEQLKLSHQGELTAARMQLERAVEISKQKDNDHSLRIEDLQGEITQRERHIKNLEEEIRKLQNDIDQLKKEITTKGKEVLKARSDANSRLKSQEEQLQGRHQRTLDNLSADHIREMQDMVAQFNQAQDMLKDKISELQIQLEEAEERYENRESRPEDLELIQQLRDAIAEREQRLKEIMDEKRFYQLELVNRETNFNKVFNSSPNVGILNPLNVKKRKGDKNPAKHSSAPSLSGNNQRLDPLPGSPLHDERLNPAKPLPQPAFTKKFVR
ncbi:protein FAM184A-like isoform X1 [Haliotis rufescens]|uniref:protein FAM184A-like isoform X1 n=1 Tax=Haliotis rufescens TaxID=6454 RepID=UPI00201FB034|nr:protein FAM184A-like isoform X1 [Haliotis rufescens]